MKNPAKHFVLLLFFLFVIFAFACRQASETGQSSLAPAAAIYKSNGVVTQVDPDAGRITIDHADIPGLMGAMKMSFAVRDAKLLEAVKGGHKIEFEVEGPASAPVVTKIDVIGAAVVMNGGEIFKTNCAECHGAAGEGAPKGISLLKGHALKHSEKDFIEMVTHGEDEKMPAFKDVLTPEQISAVVRYIREDLQKNASKPADSEHRH